MKTMTQLSLFLLFISFSSSFAEPFTGNLKDPKDFYEMLGVPQLASGAQIEHAVKKGRQFLHPDRNPGDKEAEENFKKIGSIQDYLTDSNLRAIYDQYIGVTIKTDKTLSMQMQLECFNELKNRKNRKGSVTFDDFKAIYAKVKELKRKQAEYEAERPQREAEEALKQHLRKQAELEELKRIEELLKKRQEEELEEAKARANVLQAQAIAEQKAYRAKCLRNTALFATAATFVVGTPVVYFSFFNQKVATTPSQRIETDNHFSSGGIDVIPAVGAQKTPLETKPNENDPADAASKLGRKFRDSLQGDKK